MISLDQVCVSRGGRRILDSVSIQLTPGKITAIVGPNGSGKSSLLKVMVGAIAPTEGTACVDRPELSQQ